MRVPWLGKGTLLVSRFKDNHSCHLAHIAASHANDAFSEVLGLSVENLCIDIFCWFDKSSKQKGKLNEYSQFCDQEYQCFCPLVIFRKVYEQNLEKT